MVTRNATILAALSGIVGPVVLVASFRMNPAPPASDTAAQLRDFALQHHNQIVFGGWLQGMGSLLIVLFVIALIHFAGAARRISGWITLLACNAILMVSLTEVAFYAALQVFGLLGVFNFLQPVIDILLIVQSLWFVAAAIVLLFQKNKNRPNQYPASS